MGKFARFEIKVLLVLTLVLSGWTGLLVPSASAAATFAAIADGTAGVATSTKIDLTFDSAIAGLTDSDITITDGTGAVVKGSLTGSGTSWVVALLSVTTEGNVTVAVASPNGYTISGSPKTVAVYKASSGSSAYEVNGTPFTWQDATLAADGDVLTILSDDSPSSPVKLHVTAPENAAVTLKGKPGKTYTNVYVVIDEPITLKLDNFRIAAPAGDGYDGIAFAKTNSTKSFTIEATGDNEAEGFDGISSRTNHQLTIKGSGSVTAKGRQALTTGADSGHGIHLLSDGTGVTQPGAKLIVEGNVKAYGGDSTAESGGSGIFLDWGNMLVKSGTVEAVGGITSGDRTAYSYSGSVVTKRGGYGINARGWGFPQPAGVLTVEGGQVITKGGQALAVNPNGYAFEGGRGIIADTSIKILGGTVTSTGGSSAKQKGGDGMFSESLSISGAGTTVTSSGGAAPEFYAGLGLFITNSILIEEAQVTATGGDGVRDGHGIMSSAGGITIQQGAKVTTQGGTGSGMNAGAGDAGGRGVSVQTNVYVSGAELSAAGGNGSLHGAHGVFAYTGTITLEAAAKVTAIGGNGGSGVGGAGLRAFGNGIGESVKIESSAGDVYIRGGQGASVKRPSILGKDVYIATGNVETIEMEGGSARSIKNKAGGDDLFKLVATADPAAAVVVQTQVTGALGGAYTYRAPAKSDGKAYLWLPAASQTAQASGYLDETKTVMSDDTASVTLKQPLPVVLTPADDATGVAVGANLVLTFTEAVSALPGKYITVYRAADDSVVERLEATDSAVTATGMTVNVNLVNDLYYSTDYYVLADAGAFTASAGSKVFGGVTDKTAWNFTTELKSEVTASDSTALKYYANNSRVSTIHLNSGTNYVLDKAAVGRDLTIEGHGAKIVAGQGQTDTVVRSDDITVDSQVLNNYADVQTFITVQGAGSKLKLVNVTLENGVNKNGTDSANDGIFAVINVKTGGSLETDGLKLTGFHNNPTPGNNLSFGIHAEPGAVSTSIKNSEFGSSNAFRNAVAIRSGSLDIRNNEFAGTDYPQRLRQSDGYEYAMYIYGGTGNVENNHVTGFDSTTQQGYASAGISVIGFYATDVTVKNNSLEYNESGIDITRTWSPYSSNTFMKVNGDTLTNSEDAYEMGEALRQTNSQKYVSVSLDQNDETDIPKTGGGSYFAVLGGYRSPLLSVTGISYGTVQLKLPGDSSNQEVLGASQTFGFEVQKDQATTWTAVSPTWATALSDATLALDADHTYRVRAVMTHNSADQPPRTLKTYTDSVLLVTVTADDASDAIKGLATTMEFSVDGGAYVKYDGTNAPNLAGTHSVKVRIAANGTRPAGIETTLSFTAGPETTPSAAIGFVNEELTGLTANAAYEINGISKTADANGKIAIEAGWFGTSLSIVKKGNGTTIDSTAQTLAIPSRPTVPTGVGKVEETYQNAGDGQLTGVTTAMEYKKGVSGTWSSVTGATVSGLAADTYYIRTKATAATFASEAVSVSIAGGSVQNSTINTAAASFDKYAGSIQYEDVTVQLTLNGNTLRGILLNGTTVSGSVYSIDQTGKLTISKQYLATLGGGAQQFTLDMSGGTDPVLTVTVVDTTPGNSTINIAAVSFDKYAGSIQYADVMVQLTLNGNTLRGILLNGTTVSGSVYSIDQTGKLTISKQYLATLGGGAQQFTLDMSGGTDPVLTVTVIDTTPGNSTINTAAVSFDKYAGSSQYADVTVQLMLNGNTLRGLLLNGTTVSASVYSFDQAGKLTISKQFLATLGTGNYTFTLDMSGGVDPIFTVTISDSKPPVNTDTPDSGGGGDETGTGSPTGSTVTNGADGAGGGKTVSVDVYVNGKAESAGTASIETVDGQTVTTISVDRQKLEAKLEAEGMGSVVTVVVINDSQKVVGELTGEMVHNMEQKQAVLVLQTPSGSYSLPSSEIRIASLAEQLGAEVKDVKLTISIAQPSADKAAQAQQAIASSGLTAVTLPVEFTVTVTYGNRTIEVTDFAQYVARTVALPPTVDPSRITTGVVAELDGTTRHVPTQVTRVNEQYFAKINSLTNSTYFVIWNPVRFGDMNGHWAQSAVNDMGSRTVINGVGGNLFHPEREITRAEFAAVVVRGLGLRQTAQAASSFQDVKPSDWFSATVSTAAKYGLVSGYEDGSFRPQASITRQEAMTIMARAMTITGLKDKLGRTEALPLTYEDGQAVAEWALDGVTVSVQAGILSGRSGAKLAPEAWMTRAEVATVMQRLLKRSGLID